VGGHDWGGEGGGGGVGFTGKGEIETKERGSLSTVKKNQKMLEGGRGAIEQGEGEACRWKYAYRMKDGSRWRDFRLAVGRQAARGEQGAHAESKGGRLIGRNEAVPVLKDMGDGSSYH